MTEQRILRGLLVPTVTPFNEDLSVDVGRFEVICRWQLANGANGLAVFGTTSEGNSLSVKERRDLLDHLVQAGVSADRLMPGCGACALPDAVEMTRHAVRTGAGGVLVLPPFYYPDPDEEAVFRFYAELIERVGEDRLRLYVYHIPHMTRVRMGPVLLRRLVEAYPASVVGLKDSSGDWEATRRLIEEVPELAVFPGAETFVSRGLAIGAAGCISATANIQPGAIADVIAAHGTPEAPPLQEAVDRVRATVASFPMIPAIKAILARETADGAWERLRPPLAALEAAQRQALFDALDTLPDYRRPELASLGVAA